MLSEQAGTKSQWACRLACQLIKGHHGEIAEVMEMHVSIHSNHVCEGLSFCKRHIQHGNSPNCSKCAEGMSPARRAGTPVAAGHYQGLRAAQHASQAGTAAHGAAQLRVRVHAQG